MADRNRHYVNRNWWNNFWTSGRNHRFYPILIPIFLLAGYDTLTAVATIYLGTAIGTMSSTINPFSTVIASNAAGISFTDGMPLRILMWIAAVGISILYTIRYAEKVRLNPAASLVAEQAVSDRERFLGGQDREKTLILPDVKNFH